LKLIPVIDLLGGHVVHARRGQRSQYLPLRSSLCEGSRPETVVGALLDLHPFHALYIADLDAIQRRGQHADAIAGIRRRFPSLELWVDSGIGDGKTLQDWIDSGLGTPVIGSESLVDPKFMIEVQQRCRRALPVLSLDFRGETFQGPTELLSDPDAYWPHQVLAMNLARVGSGSGPDLALIERLMALAPDRAVYAAGGIGSAADLEQVARAGAAGALLASALHDRRLGKVELARFDAGWQSH
jgi:phosphoribosylformimino-5-aminoimidazole carboxamide ribotide isomerase